MRRETAPEMVLLAKLLYETREISFSQLTGQFDIQKTLIGGFSNKQGWTPFPNVVEQLAKQVETEAMEAVKKHRPGRPVNGQKPFELPKRSPGRPRIYPRDRNARPTTEEQILIKQARELWEAGKGNKAQVAALLGIPVTRLYHASKVQNWVDPRLAKMKAEYPESFATSGFIIPPPSPDTAKAQLQITLSAIRGMMSRRQIYQLDDFEELIAKYGHLIEVYLDPHRFVDERGLSADEIVRRVAEVQGTALRLLTPTKQDSLSGSLKTYTDALMRSIELKRAIAGLNKLVPPPDGEVDEEQGGDRHILDMQTLSTEELRVVQRGMELLERHQRAARSLPRPPAPDGIDDLLGPEPQVVQDPDIAPR